MQPAFVSLVAEPAEVLAGEMIQVLATVTDAVGEAVADGTQVEFHTNDGGVMAPATARTYSGVAVSFLLTSSIHAGQCEVVAFVDPDPTYPPLIASVRLGVLPGTALPRSKDAAPSTSEERAPISGVGHADAPRSDLKAAGFSDSMLVSPVFRGRTFPKDPKSAFVLMPLSVPELSVVYENYVKTAVNDSGLSVRNAADIFSADFVMEDVWSAINGSRIIIAELTARNPNVFYELGVAHAIGRHVILITQDDPVFDVTHYRHIIYKPDAPGCEQLRQHLTETINLMLADGTS